MYNKSFLFSFALFLLPPPFFWSIYYERKRPSLNSWLRLYGWRQKSIMFHNSWKLSLLKYSVEIEKSHPAIYYWGVKYILSGCNATVLYKGYARICSDMPLFVWQALKNSGPIGISSNKYMCTGIRRKMTTLCQRCCCSYIYCEWKDYQLG